MNSKDSRKLLKYKSMLHVRYLLYDNFSFSLDSIDFINLSYDLYSVRKRLSKTAIRMPPIG